MVTKAFVQRLNWNVEGKKRISRWKVLFFCHRLLWIFTRQEIRTHSTPGLSLFHTDALDILQKTLQLGNNDPLLIEPGTYCIEGAWKLSLPARLVESDQSSVSSWEDCVTQLLVNFQLKTKPVDNVSAFCLLNSIIWTCLLSDKNNHFSILVALQRHLWPFLFFFFLNQKHINATNVLLAALQPRPAFNSQFTRLLQHN